MINTLKKRKPILSFLIVLSLCLFVASQEPPRNLRASTCEHFKSRIDLALIESKAAKLPLIVIFRMGESEDDDSLNQARIESAKAYINDRGYLGETVYAVSDSSRHPKMDLYVRGKLFAELLYVKNDKESFCR